MAPHNLIIVVAIRTFDGIFADQLDCEIGFTVDGGPLSLITLKGRGALCDLRVV